MEGMPFPPAPEGAVGAVMVGREAPGKETSVPGIFDGGGGGGVGDTLFFSLASVLEGAAGRGGAWNPLGYGIEGPPGILLLGPIAGAVLVDGVRFPPVGEWPREEGGAAPGTPPGGNGFMACGTKE